MKPQFRLAILASHPIQYQVPLFQALAKVPEVDLEVLFCSDAGLKPYRDTQFGVTFAWDIPLLRGYKYIFLRESESPSRAADMLRLVYPVIASTIMNGRFDAILIHGWGLASSWVGSFSALASRVPILLRGESNGMSERTGFSGKLKKTLLASYFHRVSGFLVIGTNNRRFYESYGIRSETIFQVPYAVDNQSFILTSDELSANKLLLRDRLKIRRDLPVVLFVGKLIPKKRPFDLLYAFEGMTSKVDASLVFVGDGVLRPAMEKWVKDHNVKNVHFVGFTNQSKIGQMYALADVFVLPSSLEPWGLAVNEAMCFSLPVITSDKVGSAVDLVKEGVNGFTYPSGDNCALAACLTKILTNDSLRASMGLCSRSTIEGWGIAQSVCGILEALKAVTGRTC